MTVEVEMNNENINQFDSNGFRHGFWRALDTKKHPQYEGYYVNGKRHGHWKYYHQQGVLWFEADFYKDELNGISKVYSIIGKLDYINYHIKGIREGEQVNYHGY